MLSTTDGGKKAVIMIVDDEEVIRNMVNVFLKSYGYEVILASNGMEAIEKIQQTGVEVSLVFLDMMLPGITGMEVFKRLRQTNPKIKAILTSGYTQDILEEELDESTTSFLQKPFRINELIQKIEEMIGVS